MNGNNDDGGCETTQTIISTTSLACIKHIINIMKQTIREREQNNGTHFARGQGTADEDGERGGGHEKKKKNSQQEHQPSATAAAGQMNGEKKNNKSRARDYCRNVAYINSSLE